MSVGCATKRRARVKLSPKPELRVSCPCPRSYPCGTKPVASARSAASWPWRVSCRGPTVILFPGGFVGVLGEVVGAHMVVLAVRHPAKPAGIPLNPIRVIVAVRRGHAVIDPARVREIECSVSQYEASSAKTLAQPGWLYRRFPVAMPRGDRRDRHTPVIAATKKEPYVESCRKSAVNGIFYSARWLRVCLGILVSGPASQCIHLHGCLHNACSGLSFNIETCTIHH